MFQEEKERAHQLYNEGRCEEALEIYEKLKEKDFDSFNKSCSFRYMWCIYKTKIKSGEAFLPENRPQAREYFNFILNNCSEGDLLYILTVFAVVKHLKNDYANFQAEQINRWLDKLNPENLSDQVRTNEKEGKEIVFMSQKEEWYALKSKACEKLKIYQECLRISQEALQVLPQFHHNNEIWFKRRIALSKYKLGNSQEAIDILTDLLKFKKEWFIYSDISEIYLDLGDYDRALDYGLDAIFKPGEDDKRVNVYWMIGHIFNLLGKKEEEEVLKGYTIRLRLDNGWKLPGEEASYYREKKERIDKGQTDSWKKQVHEVARANKLKNQEKLRGVIAKILPNNKAGFIKSEDKSYYFKTRDVKAPRSEVKEGRKVEFFIEKGFDYKKQVETEVAVYINIQK